MPSYDFRCPRCDEDLTVLKSMSEAEKPEPCPTCHKPMARVFTVPGYRVKGGTGKFHSPR